MIFEPLLLDKKLKDTQSKTCQMYYRKLVRKVLWKITYFGYLSLDLMAKVYVYPTVQFRGIIRK